MEFPSWVREIDLLLPVVHQFVLGGNIEDLHVVSQDDEPSLWLSSDLLVHSAKNNGYHLVYSYHPAEGIHLEFEYEIDAGNSLFPSTHLGKLSAATPGKLADLLRASLSQKNLKVAFILRAAPRMWRDESDAGPDMRAFYTLADSLAHAEPEVGASAAPVVIFWVGGLAADAPKWLKDSNQVRMISVPLPELVTRRVVGEHLLKTVFQASQARSDEFDSAVGTLAELSHGMTLREIQSVVQLAGISEVTLARVDEAVRRYRYGVAESPWSEPQLLTRILTGEERIGKRVLGQPVALRRSLDVLLRSALGLTGAQSSSDRVSRPQGILFFAGPTGVGKTELAKSLAELIFGAQDSYTRFDMSEFSAEHTEARLIGAPPGYVGYGSGGELTNAVTQKPFSILLFDEIEKAHPRILDKFLQILEDGRLTDGSGKTVYFSETVIVFTSNLGTFGSGVNREAVSDEVAQRGDSYELNSRRVVTAIERHFTEELGRPEILNRIGDNLIVFDYISEDIARDLVTQYLQKVVRRVSVRNGLVLTISGVVTEKVVQEAIKNLDFGGRGVSSAVETTFVNPLSRAIALLPPQVTEIHAGLLELRDGMWELRVETQNS